MPSTTNRYLFEPDRNDYRKTIGVETSWMKKLRRPEQIAEALNRLRNGTLRQDKFNYRTYEMEETGPFYPKVEFDTVVGTGFSGVLPLLYVANALDVNWFAVRKDDDNSHTGEGVEGSLGRKWLFLDDFIETGATYKHVLDIVKKGSTSLQFATEHVGVFQYNTARESFMAPDHIILKDRLNRLNAREREIERMSSNYERFAI